MKKLGPYVVVFVLPFLFYWKLFDPNPDERRIFRGDFLNQHYVWKSYALSRVKAGELPLWNPHILGGEAFHANPQVGIFYPPTYLLLPFHHDGKVSYVALEGYQLLHVGFGGAGMLLLMASLGVGTTGALAAAVVFCFGGFFTTPGHQAIVLTASWIPWTLWLSKRAVSRKTLRSTALLALAIAAQVLAGHPQIAYYALVVTCVWAVVVGGFRSALVRFLPALVLGVGIACVQLLPTYVLAADSDRAELGYDYSTSFGFSPYFLSAMLTPRGQVRLPDQDGAAPLHVYAGVGTLLLAFIGLVLSKNRWRLFFAGAALAALLLSFGKDSPLYDVLYAGLPGFRSFRVPYRLLGIWVLGMSILAGLGIDVLAKAGRKERVRLRAIAKGAFVALLGLWVWSGLIQVRLLSTPGTLSPADVDRVVGATLWAVLLAALNFLLLLLFLWRPKDRFVLPAFVVLLALDMAAFVKDRGQHPYRTLVRAGERPIQRILRAQGEKSRYVTSSNLESYDMLFGTEFAGGHSALVDSNYRTLLDESATSANILSILNVKFVVRSEPTSAYPWCGARYASPMAILDVPPELSPARLTLSSPLEATRLVFYWRPLGPGGGASLEIFDQTHPLVGTEPLTVDFGEPTRFEAFRVLVSPGNPGVRLEDIEVDLNPIGLKTDFLDLEGIHINLHTLPRAYFAVPTEVPRELMTVEELKCWSVLRGVQVIDPESDRGSEAFFRKDAARIVEYSPERVAVETESPRDGFLVLADTWRPGWLAEVDGSQTPILRAQTALRAVAVPAGRHRVRFVYRPASLRLGSVMTLGCLAFTAALFGYSIWIGRKPGAAPEEPASSEDAGDTA